MILDASIFSRALTYNGPDIIKKYYIEDEKDIVIGNLTSMSGELVQYKKPKLIRAPEILPDGTYFKLVEKRNGISFAEVPSGIEYGKLISIMERYGVLPSLFPLYDKGTVGGFIHTNGSGFGSYKFGFIKGKKELGTIKENGISEIGVVNYQELLEVESENRFAWSAILLYEGEKVTTKYYVPSLYSPFVNGSEGTPIPSIQVIKDLFALSSNLFIQGKIPVAVRAISLDEINKAPMEKKFGYIINFNSPSKYFVTFGTISFNEIEAFLGFLNKNPSVLPFPSNSNYNEVHKTIMSKFKKKPEIPKVFEKANFSDLKFSSLYNDALKCINCGLCLDSCLAYRTTKDIYLSPVGKIMRLISAETEFEYCFGCKNDEDICPEKINISQLTEALPRLGKNRMAFSIEPTSVSHKIKELENMLEATYKNKPIFILFVGCAAKYDPIGLEGFMDFLLSNGNELSSQYSPRIKIVEGCCGFDKYNSGDIEGAKREVLSILDKKEKLNAVRVYFLCPEGLYVYNRLSGDQGILAYEVIKPHIKGKVHAGCWARKLGIEGDDKECAGLSITTYMGKQVNTPKKDVLTICPFSTWKFSTNSVYSQFLKNTSTTMTLQNIQVQDQEIVELARQSLIEGIISSADDIAERVIDWNMGGKNYFILIIIPIIRKRFLSILSDNVNKDFSLKSYFKSLLNDNILLKEKVRRVVDYLVSIDLSETINSLIPSILNSPKLDYEARNLVSQEEFKKGILEAIKKVPTENAIQDIFIRIGYT
ncbi:iron-sulfur protein [Candidatus Acidianus copahuensis]|uniref:Iron-sulfur protein n=1 Tax=Candidatus Acidianus copahuensis TaxID=1160895 RepID=A0A031LTH6_9CREN|nr:4Fe-4S dicluster domain-containing protein [Candidatus Acidianus copahuensis]EZQ10809.1 iron-sulfur protein [Candidatus Acidianus copahuensis]